MSPVPLMARLAILVSLLLVTACRSPETRSLAGVPLYSPTLPEETRLKRELALDHASTILAIHPDDEDALVWVGRRTAYLGRYREAVELYTKGLSRYPDSYRLLRHRGHRHITLRQLDAAIEDLETADRLSRDVSDEIEPDGMPNTLGKPRSTTKGNILYHLALARYLQGDFETAALDFQRCLDLATNDDSRVAASYWLYLAAIRSGEVEQAELALSVADPDLDLIENHTYHVLLLAFKNQQPGESPPSHLDAGVDEATLEYGLSMKAFLEGDLQAAQAHWEHILSDTNWAAFGHIAAEAELARAGS